ncbi:MAG TPA: hypothetical protein VMR95_04595 [Candidatus Binatia bacterium]|nr:hypothetical protein [Candidatus Binatia bacterium]
MAEPLQPTDPSRRFMDIVPGNKTAVSATSRPIISPKTEPPVDPMVAATPVVQASPEVDQNEPAEVMMQREYQEVEHELPAGDDLNSDEPDLPQATAVIGEHGGQKLKRRTLDKFLLVVLAIIILALVLDLLLDHGTIKFSGIPHTHLWHQS